MLLQLASTFKAEDKCDEAEVRKEAWNDFVTFLQKMGSDIKFTKLWSSFSVGACTVMKEYPIYFGPLTFYL